MLRVDTGKGEIALKESKTPIIMHSSDGRFSINHQGIMHAWEFMIPSALLSFFFCSNILANISLLHSKWKERAAAAQFKSNLL